MAILLLLVAGAGTVYAAANLRGYGVLWAYVVCDNTGNLCSHTGWLALVIASAATMYVVRKEWAS